jgi:accessory gene regulator protein AgrB
MKDLLDCTTLRLVLVLAFGGAVLAIKTAKTMFTITAQRLSYLISRIYKPAAHVQRTIEVIWQSVFTTFCSCVACSLAPNFTKLISETTFSTRATAP